VAPIPDGTYADVTALASALGDAVAATAATGTYSVTAGADGSTISFLRTDGGIASVSYTSAYRADGDPILAAVPAGPSGATLRPQLAGPASLLLRSNLAELGHEFALVTADEPSNGSAIARVQRTAPRGATTYYVDPNPVPVAARRYAVLPRLRFWWTMPGSQLPIDFAGGAWSLRLRLLVGRRHSQPTP
jgi:hypothetical protein